MSDLVERLKREASWSDSGSSACDQAAARITELEAALASARAWHESEDKALSKSGRSDREYHWMRCQHRDQIDDFRSVQPDVQYNAAWDAMTARAALAGKGDSHE